MVNLIADCFPFLLYPSVDTHTSNALLLFFHIEMRLCYTQRSAVSKILRPHHVACGILLPWPGIDPVLPALEAWSLNHWTREVPAVFTMGILLSQYLQIFSHSFLVTAEFDCRAEPQLIHLSPAEGHLSRFQFFCFINSAVRSILEPFSRHLCCCFCRTGSLGMHKPNFSHCC